MATLTYRKNGKTVKNLVSYLFYRRLWKVTSFLLLLQSFAFLAFLNKYIWKHDLTPYVEYMLKFLQ